MACFLIPIHYLTHRALPASDTLGAFGPAELDYEFVKTGLATWSVRATLLYTTLVLSSALHASEGMQILLRRAAGATAGLSKWSRRNIAFAATVPVLSGLLVIAREPLLVFGTLASRYRSSFEHVFFFRI
jgi:hypothetical protein